jgi:hypothetical protein
MKPISFVVLAGVLPGCASSSYYQRFDDMDASRAEYKACLAENPSSH